MAERRGEEFRPRARVRLPPETLRELTRLEPLRAALSLLQTWGLCAALLAIAVAWPHPLVIAACLVGLAGQQHALAILTHQSAHYRMARTRWLNDLTGVACGWMVFASMYTYRSIHRIHHNHLYTPIDPDLALMAGYPRGRWYLLRKLGKDLLGLTTFKNYLYFLGRPPPARDLPDGAPRPDTSPALARRARRDRAAMTAFWLALGALSIALGFWPWLLLLWVLPLATLLQLLLRLRAVCEHGAVPDTAVTHRAARTNLAPLWIRWILFPHNMHFHVEHHLYPAVPHYRLPDCHRALRARGLLDDAEVARFGDTLARVFAPPAARPVTDGRA